jgi:hypothetical protein
VVIQGYAKKLWFRQYLKNVIAATRRIQRFCRKLSAQKKQKKIRLDEFMGADKGSIELFQNFECKALFMDRYEQQMFPPLLTKDLTLK